MASLLLMMVTVWYLSGQLGRLDRFDHGALSSWRWNDRRCADQKDLAGQHLALPGLIADLFSFRTSSPLSLMLTSGTWADS